MVMCPCTPTQMKMDQNEMKISSSSSFKLSDTIHRNLNESNNRRGNRDLETTAVIWLDPSIVKNHGDIKYSISALKKVASMLETFSVIGECMEYIKMIPEKPILIIVSGSACLPLLASTEKINRIQSIYIFCRRRFRYRHMTVNHRKLKGIYKKIEPICECIREDLRRYENFPNPTIFYNRTVEASGDELDRSVIYSQLLKEIIMNWTQKKESQMLMWNYLREKYLENEEKLGIISSFENDYERISPAWWCTKDCFIYSLVNRALRSHHVEIIIRSAFFIRGVILKIEEIHRQIHSNRVKTIYFALPISSSSFRLFEENIGRTFSFESFLTASTCRQSAMQLISKIQHQTDLMPVLFVITIDQSISAIPFAVFEQQSSDPECEYQILFSLNALFRIDSSQRMEKNLWQIQLTPLGTEQIEEDTKIGIRKIQGKIQNENVLFQLAFFMCEIEEYNNAEEIYSMLLDGTIPDNAPDIPTLHYNLGCIKERIGDFFSAKAHYECAGRHALKNLSMNHPLLSSINVAIGTILRNHNDLDGALERFQSASNLEVNAEQIDTCRIVDIEKRIASILNEQRKYSAAIDRYERVVSMIDKNPQFTFKDHRNLLETLVNLHVKINDLSVAIFYFEKLLQIQKQSAELNLIEIRKIEQRIMRLRDQLATGQARSGDDHEDHVYGCEDY